MLAAVTPCPRCGQIALVGMDDGTRMLHVENCGISNGEEEQGV